jgi:hypothetical protein
MQDLPNQTQGEQPGQSPVVVPTNSVPPEKANPSTLSQPSLSQPSLTPNMGTPTAPPMPSTPDVKTEFPNVSAGKGKKPLKLILVLILVFSLLMGLLAAGAGVMVAYGMVPLDNQKLKDSISKIVFSLPFIPKTKEYVLAQSILAHKEVSSAAIEASVASTSQSLSTVLGGQNFDLSISGPIDYSDSKNLKASIRFQLTSEFDSEVRVNGQDLYFKIDKVPATFTSMITAMLGEAPGFKGFDPLLGKWVHHKFETLDTDARKLLDENKKEEEPFDQVYQELTERILREKILPEVKMTSENVDGAKAHKLYVDLSGSLIDEIFKEIGEIEKERKGAALDIQDSGTRPSEIVKKLAITLWIDEKSYYLKKATVETRLKQDFGSGISDSSSLYGSLFPSLQDTVDLVFSIKLAKIGEPVTLEVPADSMSTEEFIAEAMKLLGMGYVMQQQVDMAKFYQARANVSSLGSAAEMYFVDKQRYPDSIETIVESGYLSDSILSNMEESQLKYKVNAEGSVVVVFTLLADTSNLDKPYYVYISGDPDYSRGNYSGQELADALTKHGLGVNPVLYEPVTVPEVSEIPEEQDIGDMEYPSFGAF